MVNTEDWDIRSRAFKVQYIVHFLLSGFFFFFLFFTLINFLATIDLAFLLVFSLSLSLSHIHTEVKSLSVQYPVAMPTAPTARAAMAARGRGVG